MLKGQTFMDHAELAKKVSQIASLTGKFTLRSGIVSDRYFDKYRFEGDPVLLREVAKGMLKLIPSDTEILAGLELGGVPIATAMSLESGLPVAFVRKEAKTYGTCQAIEGQVVKDRKVCFVEDVITTGGAVADALELSRADGANVLAVVCAIWRGEGAPHIKKAQDLDVRPLFTREDLEG
ncbi:MAG: orotate phosphoribosyltransferase [Rhizobiaceae bacterium]|nr:orotate phosphoribosyltransferase [Rhizobiaceae bacterium]